MPVSRAEIANRALRRCGVIGFGQSADANRNAAALQAYDEVYAYLDGLNIVEWTSAADVPDKYAFHVVALVALNLCDDVSVPAARYERIRIDAGASEASIRRVFKEAYQRDETKAENF